MNRLFDAHLHIIDPRFPLLANQGYLPEPFPVAAYRTATADYELAGGAVVSGSFQGFDQSYLLAALEQLGPTFVGVTQLPHTASDAEIFKLDAAGVRAVRFNLKRGGSEQLAHLESLARRVFELVGWHVELYVDSRELDALKPILVSLPAVSIDHLGLAREGIASLLELVEKGVKVKATGFGRVDFDVATVIEQLVFINPECLMFGTDLPSTRAPVPYRDADYRLIAELLDPELVERVMVGNALDFYQLQPR
jgi:predicted TIM-barrel fold metal-dependent hydrolase